MKISTVNRCVEVLSNSMAVLPVYIMNERTKERLPDHRLGRVLWERANEAMTAFDYQRLMLCNELLPGKRVCVDLSGSPDRVAQGADPAATGLYDHPCGSGWPCLVLFHPPHHRRRHHAPAGGDPALQSVQRGRH